MRCDFLAGQRAGRGGRRLVPYRRRWELGLTGVIGGDRACTLVNPLILLSREFRYGQAAATHPAALAPAIVGEPDRDDSPSLHSGRRSARRTLIRFAD